MQYSWLVLCWKEQTGHYLTDLQGCTLPFISHLRKLQALHCQHPCHPHHMYRHGAGGHEPVLLHQLTSALR